MAKFYPVLGTGPHASIKNIKKQITIFNY